MIYLYIYIYVRVCTCKPTIFPLFTLPHSPVHRASLTRRSSCWPTEASSPSPPPPRRIRRRTRRRLPPRRCVPPFPFYTFRTVCVECLPADKPWDVVSATRWSSGVAPRACVRVYARVLVPPNFYIYIYIHTYTYNSHNPPSSTRSGTGSPLKRRLVLNHTLYPALSHSERDSRL